MYHTCNCWVRKRLLTKRISGVMDNLGDRWRYNGPLNRYVKLRVSHAPGMPGTFSLPPTSKEIASYRSRHASRHVRDARAVMHVGIDNPRWRGKRSWHSWRMRKPQFCVSGKRPMHPANMHMACVLLRIVVVWNYSIDPYPSGLFHWHWDNLTITSVIVDQSSRLWVNS